MKTLSSFSSSSSSDLSSVELVPFGTCQVCGRAHRVLKNGMIARHGWRAHPLFRVQSSSCLGSQNLPLEVSRDRLISHVAELSEFEDFGPKTISPKGLLKLISEKMKIVQSWEPRELSFAPRVPEAPVVEASVVEAPEAPVPEAPVVEDEELVLPSGREVDAMIRADRYVLGDEVDAPIAEMKELKSGGIRLKAEKKLAVGDLVLLPARSVACFGPVSRPEALVPTRILRVSKGGIGLDFIYIGKPLFEGEVDEVSFEELKPYRGIFQP